MALTQGPVQQDSGITAVAHAIQLSVAPVFLLSGIGAMLAVMTNRLSRIIDRARVLEAQLCTTTALLVCAVIATGFLSAVLLRFDASVTVAMLFIAAMVTFFVGLVLFLREIFVATTNLRIGPR